jgi:hypothetical protein
MVMPAKMKQDFLGEAEFILQIQLKKLEASPDSPGNSVLRGRLLRQFKGVRRLDPEEEVVIKVTTYNRGSLPPPGDCYSFIDEIEGASFLEVYLEQDGPGKYRAIDTQVIPSPTRTPYYLDNHFNEETSHENVESTEGFWRKLKRLLTR